jgi:predicted AAA+ superfamily ATPase
MAENKRLKRKAAAKKLGLSRGTIITYDEQDTIQESDVSIDIVPLPIFLCGK